MTGETLLRDHSNNGGKYVLRSRKGVIVKKGRRYGRLCILFLMGSLLFLTIQCHLWFQTVDESDPTWMRLKPALVKTWDRKHKKDNHTITVSVFYNVYLPPNNVQLGLDIVKEQLRDLNDLRRRITHNNTSVDGVKVDEDITLYYTQIGNTSSTIEATEGCKPCERLHNVQNGNEILTMQALYDHCRNVEHPETERVAYIHTKGSFTDTIKNRRLRQLLTNGTLSDACIRKPMPSPNPSTFRKVDACNLCSTQFSVFPAPQTIGNMFVADCNYIKKLLPPQTYAKEKKRIFEKSKKDFALDHATAMASTNTDTIQEKDGFLERTAWQLTRDAWIGLGRYSMEHWVYSHPDVVPCDVYQGPTFGYSNAPPLRNVIKSMARIAAPRYNQQIYLNRRKLEYHPWFLLPGRMYEWNELYHSIPPSSSWVWVFYSR